MGVQSVTGRMSSERLEVSLDHVLQTSQKIRLGASRSAERCYDFSGDDIAAHNEGAGAMSKIFKLAPLDFARNQR